MAFPVCYIDQSQMNVCGHQEAEAVPGWVLEELSQLQEVLQTRDADIQDLVNDMQHVMETANAAGEEVTQLQTKVCRWLYNNICTWCTVYNTQYVMHTWHTILLVSHDNKAEGRPACHCPISFPGSTLVLHCSASGERVWAPEKQLVLLTSMNAEQVSELHLERADLKRDAQMHKLKMEQLQKLDTLQSSSTSASCQPICIEIKVQVCRTQPLLCPQQTSTCMSNKLR